MFFLCKNKWGTTKCYNRSLQTPFLADYFQTFYILKLKCFEKVFDGKEEHASDLLYQFF